MRIILTLLILSFSLLFSDGGLLRVDWSKVSINQQKLKVLPKILKSEIKDVTLPVYLPSYYIYEKNMSIVANPNFYAITIFLDKAILMVSGDRTYQRKIISKDKNLNFKIKSLTNKFIHAEGMVSIDFQRNGVNYSLSLECDKPNSDLRCKENLFLNKIYKRLILIGGKR